MLSLLLFFPQRSFVRYLLSPQLYSEPEAWGCKLTCPMLCSENVGGQHQTHSVALVLKGAGLLEQFLCAIKPVLQGIEPSVGHVKSI